MPVMTEALSAAGRSAAMRERPVAISAADRQLSSTDAGIQTAITLTKVSAMACPSGSMRPTIKATHQLPLASMASAIKAAMAVSPAQRAAKYSGALPCSCQARCIGIITAGTPSFCIGMSGIITAVPAPRKLSATSEAPNTRAINSSRAKPRILPSSAPLASSATIRKAPERLRANADRLSGRVMRAPPARAGKRPAPKSPRTGSQAHPT